MTKTANPGTSFQATYNPATNQYSSIPGCNLSSFYDGNGNVTNDCLNKYSWDAYGRPVTMVSVSTNATVNLTYDALGRTVEQYNGSSYTEIDYTPTGAKLALMNGQTLVKAFVALPGGAQAVYTYNGNTTVLAYYRHSDWLGSSRVASTPNRTMFSSTAIAPFGETYAQSGTTDVNFTGQNQDTVSGVYDFPAREYGATSGRWPSPDPAGLAAVNPANPQSWNRYAYVQNDPLSSTDPLGLCVEVTIGGTTVGYFGDNCGGGGGAGGLSGGDCTFEGCAANGYGPLGNYAPSPTDNPWPWQPVGNPGGWGSYCTYGGSEDAYPCNPLPPLFDIASSAGPGGGGKSSPPAPCNSPILQSQYLTIYAQMGADLGVNPMFIMSISLQESGWNLVHVYETNSSSGGKPLNNLFGTTYAGGNNQAYPNVQASATAWEQNWGSYLTNSPQTIGAFTADLTSNPVHMHNKSPGWPGSVAADYNRLLNEFKACNLSLPKPK